jgi:septum formation protein
MPAYIDEESVSRKGGILLPPADHVTVLSAAKTACAADKAEPPCAVIAADTVICHNNKILEKPTDSNDAFNMIKNLQGQNHEVYTGVTVTVKTAGRTLTETFCDVSKVHIRPLTDGEIRAYVNTGEPMGKSGSYAINGIGSLLIDMVQGDFNSVVGLPLARLCVVLRGLGVDLMGLISMNKKAKTDNFVG